MKSYEEYQKELLLEIKQKILKSEELDDVVGGYEKPRPMDSDQIMDLLKGNKFKFSLDHGHFNEYLIEARRIAEKILKRSVVNIDRGLQTIQEHLKEVNEPQYRSVFLMRLYQVAIEQVKTKEAAELTKLLYDPERGNLITKQ